VNGATTHDIICYGCRAYNNGNKTSGSDGDGFTGHGAGYNLYIYYCIAYANTCSGFAFIETSHGRIWNCVAYANAGNWSLEGGGKVDQTRAGFYFAVTGNNPTTGTSWDMKNTIGVGNYPREIFLTAACKDLVTFDYNLWSETTPANFATLDGGATNISWATYHATYEAHSVNGAPGFTNAAGGVFTLTSYTSVAVDAGTDVNLTTDYAGNAVPGTDRDEATPDIGAYQMTAAQIAAQRDTTNAATLEAQKAKLLAPTNIAFGASSVTGTLPVARVMAANGGNILTTDVRSDTATGTAAGGTIDLTNMTAGNIRNGVIVGGVTGTAVTNNSTVWKIGA
jgi:hypothetical protein